MFKVEHPLINHISPNEIFILEDDSKIVFIDFYAYLPASTFTFRFISLSSSFYSNNDLWFNDKLISNRGLKIKYKYIPLKQKINLL